MDTLEGNIVKLLNAGFELKITSDGNTFTVIVIDECDSYEESNISLEALIQGLVEAAIIESKSTIVNAKARLKRLDPMNLKNWKEV